MEDEQEANNQTPSRDPFSVSVEEILLGSPLETFLAPGQSRLFQVTVPEDQTLRVTLATDDEDVANELFLRHDDAPTSALFDAAYQGGLMATQTAVVPSTDPGVYYILARRYQNPDDDSTSPASVRPAGRVVAAHGNERLYRPRRVRGAGVGVPLRDAHRRGGPFPRRRDP